MFNGRWPIPEAVTPRRLAAAFVLYGLVAIGFLALNVPPFQNPDEPAHLLRAAQIADGRLVGTRFTTTDADGSRHLDGGGPVDPALGWAFFPFQPIMARPDTRATSAMWAPRVHWSKRRINVLFSNTAINPPLFYLPASIGVLVGRATRMTVPQTVVLSRVLTGTAALAVAAAAIACAGGAAVWLFAVLTLPMSLSLMASPSQDAFLLVGGALAGALLVRLLRWPGDRDRTLLVWLAVAIALVAMARPPFAALALLPLGLSRLPLRSRIVAAAAIAACVMAWSGIAAATALTNVGAPGGADPATQMVRLRADPLLFVYAMWNALAQNWPRYLEQFVGRLGWLDLALPPAYHTAARAMLAIAAVAAMLGLRGERITVVSRAVIAAGLLLSVIGLFAILYLSATAPGDASVEGLQGRYFLPLAPAVAALLPALGNARRMCLHQALVLSVAAFPVVTLAVVMRAVVLRYYLG